MHSGGNCMQVQYIDLSQKNVQRFQKEFIIIIIIIIYSDAKEQGFSVLLLEVQQSLAKSSSITFVWRFLVSEDHDQLVQICLIMAGSEFCRTVVLHEQVWRSRPKKYQYGLQK